MKNDILIKCPICGTILPQDTDFCVYCGTLFDKETIKTITENEIDSKEDVIK